jgi:hypothetical protein
MAQYDEGFGIESYRNSNGRGPDLDLLARDSALPAHAGAPSRATSMDDVPLSSRTVELS